VRGSLAFPVDGHPCGPSAEPAFRIDEGHVYPAAVDHDGFSGAPAWFEVRAAQE
jgi:hypothetical protein